jgi:hypothetical protein
MRILVNKQSYRRQYALFGITHTFYPDESDYCWNITGLAVAIEPSSDHAERHPQCSNI